MKMPTIKQSIYSPFIPVNNRSIFYPYISKNVTALKKDVFFQGNAKKFETLRLKEKIIQNYKHSNKGEFVMHALGITAGIAIAFSMGPMGIFILPFAAIPLGLALSPAAKAILNKQVNGRKH